MLIEEARQRKKLMTDSTLYMIYLGIITKILLFFKEVFTASKIGANYKMDSYILALGIIMLISTIIGEALIVSIVPLIHQIKARDGEERKFAYINNLLSLTFILSLFLMLIGYIIAPRIIKILAPGFSLMEVKKSTRLFRLGLPTIGLVWINSIFGGFLQTDYAFKAGARGEVLSASIYIIYIILFSSKFAIDGLMFIGNLAIFAQVYLRFKVMKAKKFKYKFKIDFRDKYIKKTIGFIFPIILGLGVSQSTLVVDNALASTLEIGAIAELNYANQIIQLFLGVVVAAIVRVIFPVLAETYNKEDCFKCGNFDDFNKELTYGIKIIITLALPMSVILMTMAESIVKLLFERGAFGLYASLYTSEVLVCYGLGLVAMGLMPLIRRTYYAIHDLKTPIVLAAIALGFNILIDLILIRFIGAKGLALGTSISAILAVIYGLYDLNKKLKFTKNKPIKRIVFGFFSIY